MYLAIECLKSALSKRLFEPRALKQNALRSPSGSTEQHRAALRRSEVSPCPQTLKGQKKEENKENHTQNPPKQTEHQTKPTPSN